MKRDTVKKKQISINYCRECKNHGDETYQNIYFCKVFKTNNHSIINCKSFKKL